MKRNKKITKIFIALSLAIVLLFAGVIGVSANEAAEIAGEVVAEDEEANIFAQIYSVAEENADKIFSALAFIGTLIVGAMYKSGLLPLLSDALGKLRGALDGIKSENERYESIVGAKISDIGNSVKSIEESIGKTNGEIARIESSLATYERALAERECMKIILSSQIDMLYSIFMASSLPQFEKEEIGNKISKMREELNSYAGNE